MTNKRPCSCCDGTGVTKSGCCHECSGAGIVESVPILDEQQLKEPIKNPADVKMNESLLLLASVRKFTTDEQFMKILDHFLSNTQQDR